MWSVRRLTLLEAGSPAVLKMFRRWLDVPHVGAESSGPEFCFRPNMLSAFLVWRAGCRIDVDDVSGTGWSRLVCLLSVCGGRGNSGSISASVEASVSALRRDQSAARPFLRTLRRVVASLIDEWMCASRRAAL